MADLQSVLAKLALVVGTAAASAPLSLYDELGRVIFYSNGTVSATHEFVDVPMSVSYNEPDNVSCARCGWAVRGDAWTYPWQKSVAPPTPGVPRPRHRRERHHAEACPGDGGGVRRAVLRHGRMRGLAL